MTAIPACGPPVAISASSRPFTVQGVDLAGHGYTLDEHFVSGTAGDYDWGPDGAAAAPRLQVAGTPYTTRALVRRPRDPEAFSGNVWVELLNPSRGYDVELQWPSCWAKLVRDGDIHVGVTVKPVSVAALRRFDPGRYAPLSMAGPTSPDEDLSVFHASGLTWDVVSQVGALLHGPASTTPLAAYDVRRVFLTGVSQTGMYVNTWAAHFSATATRAGGGPVYDGIVSVISAGRLTPLSRDVPALEPGDPRTALPPGHVPFMRIDSQSETFTLGGHAWRRADSDAPADPYRAYEIAGAAHGWADIYNHQPPFADIAAAGGVPISFAGCVERKWNSLPRQLIEPGLLTAMERWVAEGRVPPRQAEPLRVLAGGTPEAAYETDEHGNVLGGLRTPYVDVPIATYRDWATDREPGGFGALLGHEVPFASATLERLYGSHQDYVARVEASVRRMLDEGWLEPPEAERIVLQARSAAIP